LAPHPPLSDASDKAAAAEENPEERRPSRNIGGEASSSQAAQNNKRQKTEEEDGLKEAEAAEAEEWPTVEHEEKQAEQDSKESTAAAEATAMEEENDNTVKGERAEAVKESKEDETMKKEEQNAKGKRERSRSPMERDETYRRMVRESRAMARRLDGLPPEAEDQEFLAEEFNERSLTPEQRKEFDQAKDEALKVWIDNKAWKVVPMEVAREGEVVPARFIQRWKPKPEHPNGRVANARVILQGFRHSDVLNKELETESPTLSRVGRMSIMSMVIHKQWRLLSADVKSAFMQADSIDEETRIYIQPSADMRRRLERLMGLRQDQLLKATKPQFGDVRAPRQWYGSADRTMVAELTFLRHPLDRCVYLSVREVSTEGINRR
jgi:chemotaxis protein histidine kinase CheA